MYNAYSLVCVSSVNIYIYSVYAQIFLKELNFFLNELNADIKIHYVYKFPSL